MNSDKEIHVPGPSYWPIALAIGLLLIADGVLFGIVQAAVGVVVLLGSIAGWTLENRREKAQHE